MVKQGALEPLFGVSSNLYFFAESLNTVVTMTSLSEVCTFVDFAFEVVSPTTGLQSAGKVNAGAADTTRYQGTTEVAERIGGLLMTSPRTSNVRTRTSTHPRLHKTEALLTEVFSLLDLVSAV